MALNQRWFGGKGREFAIVDQQSIGTIPNVGQEWSGPGLPYGS